jgi:hypothetical protein
LKHSPTNPWPGETQSFDLREDRAAEVNVVETLDWAARSDLYRP